MGIQRGRNASGTAQGAWESNQPRTHTKTLATERKCGRGDVNSTESPRKQQGTAEACREVGPPNRCEDTSSLFAVRY